MRRAALLMVLVLFASTAEARVFGRRGGSSYRSLPAGGSCATAQGVADAMAKLEWVGHFGLDGHKGYEGCGSGSSPEAAYRGTCYASSGMKTVDSGVAQGKSGRWYCCRRFVP